MKKTILIVDDNESIVFTVREQLIAANSNWQVVTAAGGKQALEILKIHKVDLLVLDIMMPDIDGWKLASILKADENLASIPIIFLTAKTDAFSRSLSSLTSVDYIQKPFTMEDLVSKVDRALKKK